MKKKRISTDKHANTTKINNSNTNDVAERHSDENTMSNIHKQHTYVDNRQCVHSDLKTMPRSVRGYKYFAVFVHGPTRHVSVKLLKRKSELSDNAQHYIEWAQKQGNVIIVEFRSDMEKIYTVNDLFKMTNHGFT